MGKGVILLSMAFFAALQVMDIYTTLLVFSLGGYESNPVMGWWLGRTGPIVGLLLGKLLAFGIYLVLDRYRPRGARKVKLFYTGVVTWNLAVLALG
jgi:hypothetical protein